ncbi:MAG: GNAT family N-acyltransferase [Psychrobacter sp.]|nr:GNAT family N-acyltransferase [Psychrobacter sp.]
MDITNQVLTRPNQDKEHRETQSRAVSYRVYYIQGDAQCLIELAALSKNIEDLNDSQALDDSFKSGTHTGHPISKEDKNHASINQLAPNQSAKQWLLAAQKLRAHCFATGFGVIFENGIDSDEYDEVCLHVVLIQGEKVIATARLLDSQRAARIGRFYSEREFHLADLLKPYPYGVLEVGRTCIHPDYRGGQVLRQMWQAITNAARQLNVNAFMGCCSIPIGAGDINGWLAQLTDVNKLSVKPKYRLPPSVLSANPTIPPLLQTYLKMGASLSEQACFDVEFHCADIWVWLPFEQVNVRYQHLL